MHPTSESSRSANFVLTEFSEVHGKEDGEYFLFEP
jgi:hypothetical protein